MITHSIPFEPLLLCATPVSTYLSGTLLTNATGFFFERDADLYLVTSHHVFRDEKNNHFPDSIQIKFHTDVNNITQCADYSIPIYHNGASLWVAGSDASGEIDVAVIKIDKQALPINALYMAFTPSHILNAKPEVALGTPMLIVGFPLGFYDTLHKLPVVRQAINASSLAMRFQGNGYFLTDARTHRGSSGAPVVCRNPNADQSDLSWILLGVHSARLDMISRDANIDEALGLNCAWFADILLKLTET